MNRPDEELLTKYFNNQLGAKEAKQVLEWLSTSEGQRYLSQRISEDFDAMDSGHKVMLKPRITAEDVLRKADSQRKQPVMTGKKTYAMKWNWAAVFVGIALLLGGMTYFLLGRDHYEEYRTAYAESADIRLPDGSMVHMSGNSHLKFQSDWEADEPREIWFEGEGYFDIVKKKEANRFTVHTERDFDVQVLGTTFTITARPSTSRVVLETGSIALNVDGSSGQNQIMMQPGELVEMDQEHDLLIKKEVKAAIYTSRKNDELIFSKTPLKEIVRILKDDYGFTVIVNDSEILQEKFTGVVPSKDVDTLLEGLKTLLDVKIIREENVIKLIQ